MIDLKYLRDNLEEVQKNISNRFMQADAGSVARLYDDRNGLIRTIDELRTRRNDNAARIKAGLSVEERAALVEEGRTLKTEIAAREAELEDTERRLAAEAARIPNLAHPRAPVGREDKDNLEIRRVGEPTRFDFKPLDHVELALRLDLIDFETGAKVAGTKFYYLKNKAVMLEMALCRYALDILVRRGFTPLITPDVAREEIVEGIGFNPRGAESNIYALEGTGTCLVGTAEITLGGYYADSVLEREALPIRLAGLSHCFRREAGAAGQFSKGLYRVHQFTKVEMFVYCAQEDSEAMHEELLAIEEEIFRGLEVPYRVVDTCTGDLGAPAYRKFDIEAWMPGRGHAGEWGEVTSTSNCTDFQARRLGVRYRDGGRTRFVHMLNGTAVACSRALIVILENHQRADGAVRIPAALVPYTGFDSIDPR